MDKRLLTIQDISCVGQCSLTVALPIISACGIECSILPSSVLSNHTSKGFNGFTFFDLTDEMSNILEQWKKNKLDFDAFYTGYVNEKQIPIILKIMEQTGRTNAIRIVDPVMADNGKLYSGFDSLFPSKMLNLCKNADYILPNLTEATLLLEKEYPGEQYDKNYIEEICRELQIKTSAKNIILTGITFAPDELGVAIFSSKTCKTDYYFTKRLPKSMHGTGDCFASCFAGCLLRGKSPLESAKIAANFVVTAMEQTLETPEHWYGVSFEKALPYIIKELN